MMDHGIKALQIVVAQAANIFANIRDADTVMHQRTLAKVSCIQTDNFIIRLNDRGAITDSM
jgi:hypothetical protein